MKIYIRTRPAGIADTLSQIHFFSELCELAGFDLDHDYISIPQCSRNRTDIPLQTLLVGDPPDYLSGNSPFKLISFTRFFRLVSTNAHASLLREHRVVVVPGGRCMKALYHSGKERAALYKHHHFQPNWESSRRQLRQGMLYREYLRRKKSGRHGKSLVAHIRIGDCGILYKDRMVDPDIRRLFTRNLLCWDGFVSDHRVGALDSGRKARVRDLIDYKEEIARVIRDSDETFDEVIVCSDGFTVLAEKLFHSRHNRKGGVFSPGRHLTQENIERKLNESLFSVFDEFGARLLIGEKPELLKSSIESFLSATALVVGPSLFPTAIIRSYGIPIQEVHSV